MYVIKHTRHYYAGTINQSPPVPLADCVGDPVTYATREVFGLRVEVTR